MLTLLDCQTDQDLIDVSNVSTSSQTFINRVNSACKRLLDRGDWWATVIKAQFAVYNSRVVWPRWVGTVLAVNENRTPLKAQTGWFDFLPLTSEDWRAIRDCYPNRWDRMRGSALVNDLGTAPTFNEIATGQTNYVIVYPRSSVDAGKTMTIWGTDQNGWPATETLIMPNNTSSPPFVASSNQYQSIRRVIKDVTADYLDAYQCAANVPGTLLDLGHYEPGETKAEYRVSFIKSHFPDWCQGERRISALFKIQHVPAVMPNDLVSIGNPAAIKLMYQAIQDENASDADNAAKHAAMAVHELNLELQNKLPESQTPVSYEEFSGVSMSRHSAF